MLRRYLPVLLLPLAIVLAGPLRAAPSAELARLVEALALPDLVEIMQEEGRAYGTDIEDEMFSGRGGARWSAQVAEIYDGGRMLDTLTGAMENALEGEDLTPMVEFFTGPLGARLIALETSARRAQLDPEVEAESVARLEEMIADDDPRLALIEEFVEANDLIEQNVAGALNSNYAFFTGLADGGGLSMEVTEDQMLRETWSQEPQIRAETREWLFAFLAMAYAPLSDDELRAYIDFSRSEAGQELNAALFAGFDVMFRDISRALGLAAARFTGGQDI
ncbi:hypothetical protein Ga0609869_002396 [Rhodovulum iodosum]|uniref:DUF2059 domain-containing protein n=1 Tax=Rhodovulum iodosum TaxID=68291 RepID=A0ABV3XXL7_9RHOB|nr:hypothetical protein [Rhodovulum robiginosum]RSK35087.1 hypothetical protein EJA01_06740 [Rhodovulum robiginosum]